MKISWHRISWILVLLVAIVSCIKFIYEPDIWWQIATGEWIIENGTVPKTDIFSYTYAGEPWINVKWGAEVLMALVDRYLGVELLPLLQIGCLVLILFFIKKMYFQFVETNMGDTSKKKIIGIVIASLLALFIVNFRLNSRPEMFSHLFSILTIFIIVNHKKTNSNLVFLLIPLQIIWTNMHEAYGVGMIVMVIFLISFWVEYLFFYPKHKVGIYFKPIKYSIASILAILAMAVNPQGFKMIAHPFNILQQLSDNKFTEELISIGTEGYWQFQSVLTVIIVIILVLFLFKKTNLSLILRPIKKIGLGYSITLAAFLYLSFSSFRNIPFFIFIATPVLGYYFLTHLEKYKNQQKLYIGSCILSIVFYFAITTNFYYEKLLPKQLTEKYGLGIDVTQNPIGAANFVKENNILGKSFVDYLSSSYFIYDVPNFKSYIDLRDLDVFPTNFFNNVFFIYQAPTVVQANGKTPWQFADGVDTFNYVVLLNNPSFMNLNLHLLHQNNDFELVYGDMLNSVFIRKTEQNKEIIEKYGYSNSKFIFQNDAEVPPNNLANLISKIFNPFYNSKPRKPKDYGKKKQGFYNYLRIQPNNN